MYKNPALFLFLTVSLLLTLWFSGTAFNRLQNYYSLALQTPSENIKWFVEELSSEDFRVGASYTYKIFDQEYKGETIFNDLKFRNPSSADDELKIKASKNYVVFYDPENIYHSSLQKKFPTKECVSAGILFFIFLYFIGLGIYTQNRKF